LFSSCPRLLPPPAIRPPPRAPASSEKVADALLDAYDTDKNKVFSEAELIAMISANKLATASFSVLAQEALADTLLDKYDADKTKALKESELIAMIKANKVCARERKRERERERERARARARARERRTS
jgi:Ca2+-binding EF-hand superfamily protein